MKIKASKGVVSILWIFLIIGVAMMGAGVGVSIYFGVDNSNYVKVSATITDIDAYTDSDGDRHYEVTVNYVYNGEQYTDIPTNFWETGMYVGEVIDIYCHKDNPTLMRHGSIMIILPCILFGMGLLFTLFSAFPIHKNIKKNRIAKNVLKNGEVVHCRIKAVVPDMSYRVNGRIVNNMIECEPFDNNVVVTYTSEPFNQKYPVEIGSTIDVYRNREDASQYYVDLNSIQPPDPLAEYYFQQDNILEEDNETK